MAKAESEAQEVLDSGALAAALAEPDSATGAASAEAGEGTEADPPETDEERAAREAEEAETAAKGKRGKVTFDDKQQAVFDSAIAEQTAKRGKVERQLDGVAAERDTFKTKAEDAAKELETLRGKAVADLGLVSEFIPSKEDAETVKRARQLRSQLTWLEDQEDNPDGYTGRDAQGAAVQWTPQDIRRMVREVRRTYEDVGADAKAIEREATRKLQEVLTLGKAAQKAGWKPGTAAKTTAATAASSTTAATTRASGSPAGTAGAAARTSQATRNTGTGKIDLGAAKTREELEDAIAAIPGIMGGRAR